MKVWTEQRTGRWDQCTECAYLMAMIHGGFTRFPRGAYTQAERDALTLTAGLVPGDGVGTVFPPIDTALTKRYGVTLRSRPITTSASLRALLTPAGNAFVLAGNYKRFPAGHARRRWQPNYFLGHALCVVTLGGGKILWLDPLADAGHPGDITTISDALLFAWTQWVTMEVKAGEFAPKEAKMDQLPYFKPAEGTVDSSTPIYAYPGGPKVTTTAARQVEAAIMGEHPAGQPDWFLIGVGGRKEDEVTDTEIGVTIPDRLGWVRRNRVNVRNSPVDAGFIRAVGGAFYKTLPPAEVREVIKKVPTGITQAQVDEAADTARTMALEAAEAAVQALPRK